MSAEFDHDVIVIGGGPAGSTVARYAALGGAKVLVVDGRDPIGTPLQCGELVPTNDEMRRLCPDVPDMDDLFKTPQSAISRHSTEMHIVPPSGKPLKFDFDGYVLNRVAHDEFLVDLAKESGAEFLVDTRVDKVEDNYKNTVRDADIIVVGVPVEAFTKVIKSISCHLKSGAIVTDVGSVKKSLIKISEEVLPKQVDFVPGHPIAGTENSGPEAGFKGLFKAEAEDGEVKYFQIYGKGDPGYKATAQMVCESSLALALSEDLVSGGVLTSAYGLGDSLLNRLKQSGIEFSEITYN